MKAKTLLVMVPAVILLSSCKINFVNDITGSFFSSSGTSASVPDIGTSDTLNEADYAYKATIDFTNTKTSSSANYTTKEEVVADYKDPSNCLNLESFSGVAQGIGGMMIGSANPSIFGSLVFTMNSGYSFKGIRIVAVPRYNVAYDWSEGREWLSIDECYLSVNDKQYVKLDNDFEAKADITETEVTFTFSSAQSSLSLSSYYQQAYIHSIVVYYD